MVRFVGMQDLVRQSGPSKQQYRMSIPPSSGSLSPTGGPRPSTVRASASPVAVLARRSSTRAPTWLSVSWGESSSASNNGEDPTARKSSHTGSKVETARFHMSVIVPCPRHHPCFVTGWSGRTLPEGCRIDDMNNLVHSESGQVLDPTPMVARDAECQRRQDTGIARRNTAGQWNLLSGNYMERLHQDGGIEAVIKDVVSWTKKTKTKPRRAEVRYFLIIRAHLSILDSDAVGQFNRA